MEELADQAMLSAPPMPGGSVSRRWLGHALEIWCIKEFICSKKLHVLFHYAFKVIGASQIDPLINRTSKTEALRNERSSFFIIQTKP